MPHVSLELFLKRDKRTARLLRQPRHVLTVRPPAVPCSIIRSVAIGNRDNMPQTTSTPQPSRPRKTGLPKLIEKYYADLKDLAHQNVMYEMGTRPAFHALLAAGAKEHGWTLIAEHEKKVGGAGGRIIRPDGTFKDTLNLVRGYWEAKDTDDDLEKEIEKKRKAGYPFNNIIFEDNATAILYQHGQRTLSADMKDPAKLQDLLLWFFRHVEPEIQEFEQAIDEFKERVPELAEGLKKKIDESHRTNPAFSKAFADFFELCKTSLNPNLSQSAVDEMLIQHILTERLIRGIFDNPEFVRRNVIAAEVEKVMLAMTSQSFDRNTYLRELDRFYVAIERAARTMTDFSDKQHFLNTVYERFFQGYSVKLADTMGIVYTPQEIVDFMCASVAEVLEKEFGKKLWSDDVCIIDPCTGTGNFVVNLIRRMPKNKLEEVYRKRLFANEIMLLPYYIAALNIEHAYFEQTGRYEPFEGLCFVDTLDLAEHSQSQLGFMTARNSERVERQKRSPITVVIGNPPYNAAQADETDNNKNRTYGTIDHRISETYLKANSAQKTKLYDPYVRFFRWATDRLEARDGIVCFVTNNSFLHQTACDGLQKCLAKEFTAIYHLDLRGNVRQNPTLSGTAYNVFGIQVGVGITIAVRNGNKRPASVHYDALPLELRRYDKLTAVAAFGTSSKVPWQTSVPRDDLLWLRSGTEEEFAKLTPVATKEGKSGTCPVTKQFLFQDFSLGVSTNRDDVVYGWRTADVADRVERFCDDYNAEVDRYRRKGHDADVDSFVDYSRVKWSSTLKNKLKRGMEANFHQNATRLSLYRPFARKNLYFDPALVDRPGQMRRFLPTTASETENVLICVPTVGNRAKAYTALAVNLLPNLNLSSLDGFQCFPFYVYDDDGSDRRENITDWALDQFRTLYKNKKIDKWSIFYYVYGLLHHPGYCEKFAANLKRELPRIPYAPDFWAFSKAGKALAGLHLDYEKLKPWDLQLIETPGLPLSYRVDDKMRLAKNKASLTVNKSLTLSGIPPEAFAYRLGNRSAIHWVIDQYQVYTDPRSAITSDPNRQDDPEYIVRLVGQVIRVSIESVAIIKSLPHDFGGKVSASEER